MTSYIESMIDVPLGKMRLWEAGEGQNLCCFPGYGGLPRWLPFLEKLAEGFRVKVASLPGFPGGPNHENLDNHLDWVVSAHDALVHSQPGQKILMGSSVGGALAAEVAALWPEEISKLVLIAPFGLFDETRPVSDVFAAEPKMGLSAISNKPQELEEWLSPPDKMTAEDWAIVQLRAKVAAADILWPLSDTGLKKRLMRIKCPTLIIWGREDKIIPCSYAEDFVGNISGPTQVEIVENAGHMVEFDDPERVEGEVKSFLTKER